MTTKQAKNEDMNRNPDGKGGFGDNPQNRSNGRWDKEQSISYWYNKLGRMPDEEYNSFKPANQNQRIAKSMIEDASSSRPDIVKEITDRTEGKAPQSVDVTTDGKSINPYAGLTTDELRKLAK